MGQHTREEEKEECDRRCNTVDEESHCTAASPPWWRVDVDENGDTSCTQLKTKADNGRKSYASENVGCEWRLVWYRSNFCGGCFHVVLDRRAWKVVRLGVYMRPGYGGAYSRRPGGVRGIWGERGRDLWRVVSWIGIGRSFIFLHTILFNLRLRSNPIIVNRGCIIITAFPLSTNSNPSVSLSRRMLVQPQNILGVLRPDERSRIIEDRCVLLLVRIDVVDIFR